MKAVESVEGLDKCDHVASGDDVEGLKHGIMQCIEVEKGQTQVIFYKVNGDPDRVGSETWPLSYQKLYRCDYGEKAIKVESPLDRAERHIGHGREKLSSIIPDISNCPDLTLMSLFFTKWCKSGKGWAYGTVGR